MAFGLALVRPEPFASSFTSLRTPAQGKPCTEGSGRVHRIIVRAYKGNLVSARDANYIPYLHARTKHSKGGQVKQ